MDKAAGDSSQNRMRNIFYIRHGYDDGRGDGIHVGIEGMAEYVNGVPIDGILHHDEDKANQYDFNNGSMAEFVNGVPIDGILHHDEDEANQYDFNNGNMNNIVNIVNNDGAYNRNLDNNYDCTVVADPYRELEENRWWDEFAESDTDFDESDTDFDESDTDFDEENETSPIEHAKVPEDDPLPGASKKRKRTPNSIEEDRSSKKSRRWDESAESDTDFNKENETSPIEHAKVPEDDPLPGASKKRKRNPNSIEEDRSSKKSRRWDESAESDTDFNKENETSPIEHAKVPEDDPLPGASKKQKRNPLNVRMNEKRRGAAKKANGGMSLLKATPTSTRKQ